MKTPWLPFLVGVAAVTAASAQSLKRLDVRAPEFYCHFSPDCRVTPTTQSASFTPTNLAVTCVLESRSFPGSSLNAIGSYGYEYRVILNNAGAPGANLLTVDSLTLNFDSPQTFSYGLRGGNQVWVVTAGGPGEVAPASLQKTGTNVVAEFKPPLVLATATNQSVGTYFFGLVSTNAPRVTTAIITGSVRVASDAPVPFRAELPARTP